MIEGIQKGLRELNEKLQEFWQRIYKFFAEPGDVDALKQIANEWSQSVSSSIADVVDKIGIEHMQANTDWEGRAAEAYKALIPVQSEGLNGIKKASDNLNTSLHSLADSIDSFWLAVKCAIVIFIVAAVGAIVACFTVVGIPAAIGALAGAVGASLGLITAAAMAKNTHMDTINKEYRSIKQSTDDLGSEWRISETDMTDATTSDGDGSDWRVNV